MSKPHSTAPLSDDTATVIAIGALAATLAAVCHETLGHGLGCVGTGGHITLLTSIWFRCSKWSAITNAGGPIGNLAAGLLALVLLDRTRPNPRVKLFLLMFGALNLFWFMGQLAFNSLKNADDWHYTALQMGWPAAWRVVGAVVGIGGYVLVSRWISAIVRKQSGPRAYAIRLAYAAAAASAVIAGLMWQPDPLGSGFEGFLTLGIAPLGILYVARRAGRDIDHDAGTGPVPRSWSWISVSVVLFGVFLFVQATGLGSMAKSGLSP